MSIATPKSIKAQRALKGAVDLTDQEGRPVKVSNDTWVWPVPSDAQVFVISLGRDIDDYSHAVQGECEVKVVGSVTPGALLRVTGSSSGSGVGFAVAVSGTTAVGEALDAGDNGDLVKAYIFPGHSQSVS
jgi:hypothetical protein